MLPSCRLRWPGIIHPALHTPSPPTPWCQKQTKRKAHRKTSIKIKIRLLKRIQTSEHGYLCLVHPPFLVLSYNRVKPVEAEGMQTLKAPQPADCGAHKQKEMCCSMAPGGLPLAPPLAPPLPLLLLLASRTHGGDGAETRSGRANYSRETWRAHAPRVLMTTALTQNNQRSQSRGESGQEQEEEGGRRRRGHRGRRDRSQVWDAGTRSVVSGGADVSQGKSPVIRSMGMERGPVKFFFFFTYSG